MNRKKIKIQIEIQPNKQANIQILKIAKNQMLVIIIDCSRSHRLILFFFSYVLSSIVTATDQTNVELLKIRLENMASVIYDEHKGTV